MPTLVCMGDDMGKVKQARIITSHNTKIRGSLNLAHATANNTLKKIIECYAILNSVLNFEKIAEKQTLPSTSLHLPE